MIKFGEYLGQVYCETAINSDVDLPCSLDTKINGVTIGTFFSFLRDIASEELAKEGWYLDINDNIEELDDEADVVGDYIEQEVMKK